MDGLEVSAPAGPQLARPDSLTFAWLYQRVQRLASESHQPSVSGLERWSLWFGLGMAGIGLGATALTRLISPNVLALVAIVCLIAEFVGLALSVGLAVKRQLPQVVRPRESHAAEMDVDFAKWQGVAAELRRFPRSERETRLRFVIALRQNMTERMGLLFGGIQRLGIFPVLVALYLQFRNWQWGDWSGAFDVNLVAGLLIWAMLLLYASGWLLVGLRTRLDSYVNLLENPLQD